MIETEQPKSPGYVSRRSDAPFVSALTVILVAISAFVLGFALSRTGVFSTWFGGSGSGALINQSNGGVADFNHFWEVWTTIQDNYVDDEITNSALLEGAIKGLATSLDDVGTVYMTPSDYAAYKNDNGGNFKGVGIYLELENGSIVVASVIKGSPAEGAGLAAGDTIEEVDGVSLSGKSTDEAATMIKGEAGTDVTLTIRSLGQTNSRDVTITRAEIHADAILWEDKGDGIIYIDIERFTEATLEDWENEWDQVVSEVSAKNPSTVIVDLRYNGGGFLEAGVYAAEEFLPKDDFVTAQDMPRVNQRINYTVDRDGAFVNTNTIVLVGRYTASASEIFAGALQMNERATVIGEKTFGKGTAQSIYEFEDGSALKLTVAHWLLPDGSVLSKDNPITPDIEVAYNSDHAGKGIDDILNRALDEAKK